jgi:hypothetical protein
MTNKEWIQTADIRQLAAFFCNSRVRNLCNICDFRDSSCKVGESCERGVELWLMSDHGVGGWSEENKNA